jgi:uncharacterized protein YidB (DUF937 family)
MNQVMQVGAQFFQARLDSNQDGQVDATEIANALSGLISNEQGQLDLAGLVGKMQSSNLMDLASSWLGDGPNAAIQPEQLSQLFSQEQIAGFAAKLGISPDTALNGLANALPEVVNNASSGGSLLDAVGGVSGALNLAGKLFGR